MPMIWASLDRIWERQFDTGSFTWDRMDFEGFATNSWDGMASQTETLALTSNGETWITVTKTDYDSDILLDILYTCTANNARIVATGQYCQFLNRPPDDPKLILLTGDPFDIPTDGTSFNIMTSKMLWLDPYNLDDLYCRALKISFSIDTSLMNEPDGTYTYDISVGIGFEETTP